MTRESTLILLIALATPSVLGAQAVCPTPWRLEETLRLGSMDGADAINDVRALELDDDGNIYIAQGWIPWVSVFDPRGRPLRKVGGAGQGPGEFVAAPNYLGWKGDTLWAAAPFPDGVNHLFGSDGRQAAQIKFTTPIYAEASTYSAGPLLQDGSLLGERTLRGGSEFDAGWEAFYDAERLPILRFSRRGEVLDTIAMVGWTSDRWVLVPSETTPGCCRSGHPLQYWGWSGSLPFVPTPDGSAVILIDQRRTERLRFSPLRILDRLTGSGGRASFDLLRIGIHGDTLLRRSISYEPKPITRQDQAWLREDFGRGVAGEFTSQPPGAMAPWSPEQLARRRSAATDAITFPEFFPPVRRMVAGHDGTIWLLRELRPDRGDLWEIYDASGRLVGSVLIDGVISERWPWGPRLKILRATRDEVWGMTIDELDVPTVRRYRIKRAC